MVFKVHALDIAASTADLVVWVRIQWKDPRLVWDPKDFGGLTTTWFFLSDGMGGGEVSEIFTPDMYLWNQEEPMEQTLANTYATVSSDGTVFWSRPGRLKATCKYEGKYCWCMAFVDADINVICLLICLPIYVRSIPFLFVVRIETLPF